MNRPSYGFTLVELLVALLVASVLLTVAVPLFSNMVDKMRVRTTLDTVVEAIRTARVTAVEQKIDMKICGLANDGTCSGAAADWDSGVVVAKIHEDLSEEVVYQVRFKEAVWVKVNGGVYNIYINKQGWSAGSADSNLICKAVGENRFGYRVVINRAGRVRTEYSEDGTGWLNSSGGALDCGA